MDDVCLELFQETSALYDQTKLTYQSRKDIGNIGMFTKTWKVKEHNKVIVQLYIVVQRQSLIRKKWYITINPPFVWLYYVFEVIVIPKWYHITKVAQIEITLKMLQKNIVIEKISVSRYYSSTYNYELLTLKNLIYKYIKNLAIFTNS